MRVIFFSKYSKMYVDFENAEINSENFFNLEIIGIDLVVLNTRFYSQGIHFLGCQYVSKQSQDLRYY